MTLLRWNKSLSALNPDDLRALFERSLGMDPSVSATVATQLSEVRAEGDVALRRYAHQFDGAELTSLEVPLVECERALQALPQDFRRGLERAARNLRRVATASLPSPLELEVEPGVVVGRRADPLERVGVYAPGGKATYPSSVLMGVVPAKAAGVKEVILCSPPGPVGRPSEWVLAAAALAGADRVFAVGGAGAIAAMAMGTQSIPRVDRIVGPGNAWVAEAKRQVAGEVGIDAPAGPSEILVVADAGADAGAIARELLAQAEHDADACVVALVVSPSLADEVVAYLISALPSQPRRKTIERALRSRGAVLTLDSLEQAWEFVERFAPEHLQLAVEEPEAALARVKNAGTVFLGDGTSVAFGDYLTGANHVLPTAGAARRFSGLSVLDFVRWQTWQRVVPEAASSLAADVEVLARGEGLEAHAIAAAVRPASRGRAATAAPVARPTLKAVKRYAPTRPPCDVDLTDNTNLFGAPPPVASLLAQVSAPALTRYPSPYADRLRQTLAERWKVPVESVITGCGSDDLLDAVMRAFGEPGDRVAYCPPTFSIVSSFARANGLVPVECALTVDSILHQAPRLIYLCAPNNPTGSLLPEGLLPTLLERSSAVVILDEAYADYAEAPSQIPLAATQGRLVVVRTLSKAYGLAGLRVGYAVGTPALVEEWEKTRGPYKVGRLAEEAAVLALTEGESWVQGRIAEVKQLRERFRQELRRLGLAPLPSEGNFLLVPLSSSAEQVAQRMREVGVSVRAFPALPGIGEAVRISIGPWEQLQACLRALQEALR